MVDILSVFLNNAHSSKRKGARCKLKQKSFSSAEHSIPGACKKMMFLWVQLEHLDKNQFKNPFLGEILKTNNKCREVKIEKKNVLIFVKRKRNEIREKWDQERDRKKINEAIHICVNKF